MRMCVVMHCAMAFLWGCALGALSLLFLCKVPLVFAVHCFCVALQMLPLVHSMAIAASHHPTRAIYFAAITIFKAQAAVIQVTAGGVGGTAPTYMFSDLSGTPVATLTGNVSNGDITASGDLKTGNGHSIDDLAAHVGALAAQLSTLRAASAELLDILQTQSQEGSILVNVSGTSICDGLYVSPNSYHFRGSSSGHSDAAPMPTKLYRKVRTGGQAQPNCRFEYYGARNSWGWKFEVFVPADGGVSSGFCNLYANSACVGKDSPVECPMWTPELGNYHGAWGPWCGGVNTADYIWPNFAVSQADFSSHILAL
jgi:hypothetical protein